ncbi:MAG: glucosaminidase domain-containing protein [Candidatus Cryptobacteroides sp.]|nr:glucosaminidase domain-containing protein [Candidatus Cryptobacteroides sp.]
MTVLLSIGAAKNPKLDYIDKYSDIAIKEMKRTGVPASITLAQGILESNAGQSVLATKGNNHFGIKCHNDWKGKTMKMDDNAPKECFRVYPNAEASFRDHSDFLRSRDRYKSLFELKQTDYKGWARGLKKAGYATDPGYADKLITLIEDYELYRFDKGVKVSVKPPLEIEEPKVVQLEPRPGMKYQESVTFSTARKVYSQNGVPFVYSEAGETYASIAASNGLFLKELLKFNDHEQELALEPGTMVYLARKKAQGPVGVNKYVVEKDGETLRDIAQRFGIRYAALQKLNIVLYGKTLEEGDTVILRK